MHRVSLARGSELCSFGIILAFGRFGESSQIIDRK